LIFKEISWSGRQDIFEEVLWKHRSK